MSEAPIEVLISDIAVEVLVTGVPGSGVVAQDRESAESFPIVPAGSYELLLARTPIPDSVIVYWNGIETSFTLDGNTVTVTDAEGRAVSGDLLTVNYRWVDGPIDASLTFIGSTIINNSATEVALPDGTREGDLLVLSIGCGGFASVEPTCLDPRISVQFNPLQLSHRRKFVGFGYATSSTDPIAVSVYDEEVNGKVALATYRVAGDVSYALSSGLGPPFAPIMPAGVTKGGVMVLSFATPGDIIDGTQGAWTRDVHGYSTNQRQSIWICPTGTPAVLLPDELEWIALTIGVSDA
jgi:hypothetical protein